MRGLQTADIFTAARIVKDAGVKEEVKRLADLVEGGQEINVKALGVELILNIISNCSRPDVENAFYSIVSEWFECLPEDIKTMDPFDMIDKLTEWGKLYVDEARAKAFFKLLSKLMR